MTLPGIKPLEVRAPGYQYYWLYAAVAPSTGADHWLELPRLDSACFQVFLDQFSAHYPESLNLLILDNAPAHTAKALHIPSNVVLIDLPPYCPELNPIERLWQDLKAQLARVAASVKGSLDTLRTLVEGFIQDYTSEQLTSLTGYSYLRNLILN